MYRTNLIILLQLILSFSVHAKEQPDQVADEKFSTSVWNYLTVGASFTAGIGGRTVAINVTRQGTEDQGKIVDNRENAYFLLYSTKASYFGDSNVGFSWLLNLSTIHLKEQEISAGNTVNLGTKVQGYFATTVPTFFYNIGDRYHGHYLRAGVGLGIGIAKFDGDIMLTNSTQPNDRVRISNGTSNIYLAPGVFIDYQWENFAVRLSTAGPNVDYNGYDVNVTGSNLVFGYTYYLK
jgi:hypothetical protein